MSESADHLQRDAVTLIRCGRADDAVAVLRRAVALDANHSPSLYLLGLLAGRAGEQAESLSLLSQVIRAGDGRLAAAAALSLAASLRAWGRHDEAEAAYDQSIALNPASRDAYFGLGLVRRARHDIVGAARAFGTAAALDPGSAPAWAALAAVRLDLGEVAAAAEAAARAVALAPSDPIIAGTTASVRIAEGRPADAATLCLTALGDCEDAGLRNTLGIALKELGRVDEAADCFAHAAAADPAAIDASFNLAAARKDQGRTDEAVALLRSLVRRAPHLAAARFALVAAHLPPLYADEAEIVRRRGDYADELGRLVAWADANGAGTLADGIGAAQPFLLPYQGGGEVDLQRRYGALVCRAIGERFPPLSLVRPTTRNRRFRLGVVCGFFRDHSVWRIPTRGWMTALDRAEFLLFGYHTSALRDAETDRAQSLFDHFVQGPLSLANWRDAIARDHLDAVIFPEVGMDPTVARLAAMRLAPVQYAAWGHPVTTGYPTIDFFLSSAAMEPPDGERHYIEGLVRLPGLSAPIALPPRQPPASRRTLGLTDDDVVFWCGQSPAKYLPRFDSLFAQIAARCPTSRFVFVGYAGAEEPTSRFRQRLHLAFARDGLDGAAHCLVLPRLDAKSYNAAMGCADLVLDNPGWSGCNSLIEALGHGLPVVTLPGRTMRSRHGAAILRMLDCPSTICADEAAFVATAVRLAGDAGDAGERRCLSDTIRRALPRLDDRSGVAALADHLLGKRAVTV